MREASREAARQKDRTPRPLDGTGAAVSPETAVIVQLCLESYLGVLSGQDRARRRRRSGRGRSRGRAGGETPQLADGAVRAVAGPRTPARQ